jgi:hypothetical protein
MSLRIFNLLVNAHLLALLLHLLLRQSHLVLRRLVLLLLSKPRHF